MYNDTHAITQIVYIDVDFTYCFSLFIYWRDSHFSSIATKQNLELQHALQLYNNAIVTNHALVNGISMPMTFCPISTPNFGGNQIIQGFGLGVESPPHYQNHFSHSNQIDNVDINLNSNFTDSSSNLNSFIFPNVGIEKPTVGNNNVGLVASPIPEKTTPPIYRYIPFTSCNCSL